MKLAPQFNGPFQILQRVGKIAYRFDLSRGSTVHPVFLVSSLKRVIGRTDGQTQVLSTFDDTGELQLTPLQVLESCKVQKMGSHFNPIADPMEQLTPEGRHVGRCSFSTQKISQFPTLRTRLILRKRKC